ncbi:oxysterol-binding protein-related protein 10 isoform X1 [Carassius auratus]|uniref:Oxysterol-binding protein n=1 Tax=Carassius auratus TaxID=7957 RepID=A0A6P6R1S7_CARAU|nr:oxysterol-binding protein-related protein 10-like isoform X1 [Carassius auratus]
MEKTLNVSHSGSSKGKWSADLGNPAHRQARSGSYSPGTGAISDTHPSQTQKRHLEGVLNKYTNLLQGWQNRYFVLDPELGQLQYFINEHSKNQKPRGSLPLIGSSVAPSDEFPYMFTVSAANGDFFKLRACDAREQQMWMTQLQLCTRRHSDGSAKYSTGSSLLFSLPSHIALFPTMHCPCFPSPSLPVCGCCLGGVRPMMLFCVMADRAGGTGPVSVPMGKRGLGTCSRSYSCCCHCCYLFQGCTSSSSCNTSSSSSSAGRTRSFSLHPHPIPQCSSISAQRQTPQHGTPASVITITHHKSPPASQRACSQHPAGLHQVKEVMSQAEGQQKNLVNSIESLPSRGPLSSLDQDLLLLKATSAATLSCLGECLSILQHNVCQAAQQITHSHIQGSNTDNVSNWSRPKTASEGHVKIGELTRNNTATIHQPHSPLHRNKERLKDTENSSSESVDSSEEITDTEDNEEEDLGVLDDQRSIILHLLSQLKLGMDLTRVVLPTFILEKRSLLEMYANFMAHPDVFLAITSGATAEERMIRFVEYYLTAFHEGRKGAVAKKPYNPILGESFQCTWDVPQDKVRPLRTTSSSPAPAAAHSTQTASNEGLGSYRLRFVAEQVSHHPPVSGFYCECKERQICVNTHVWTKSKFMGMSIGVSMVGEGVLHLLEHDEEYVFTLPSAYARSILTVPWVELGGKVSICCAKSGYSSAVTFHTKPFYGGKVHRVTAEVKHNPTGTIVCKAQGEWNGTLEFTYSSGETKVIDTSKLPVIKKKIRPLEKQGQYESRRLWQRVTAALKAGDIDAASEHKHQLEEKQRREGKQRTASSTTWKPKYFIKEADGWVYHSPLWKAK